MSSGSSTFTRATKRNNSDATSNNESSGSNTIDRRGAYVSGSESSQDEFPLFNEECLDEEDDIDDEMDEEDGGRDGDDNAPTPVNEGMATDEFRWVRPSHRRPTERHLEHPVPQSHSASSASIGSHNGSKRRHVTPVMIPKSEYYPSSHSHHHPQMTHHPHPGFHQPSTPMGSHHSAVVPVENQLAPVAWQPHHEPFYNPHSCHHHQGPVYYYPPPYWPEEQSSYSNCCGFDSGGSTVCSEMSCHPRFVQQMINKRHSHHGFECCSPPAVQPVISRRPSLMSLSTMGANGKNRNLYPHSGIDSYGGDHQQSRSLVAAPKPIKPSGGSGYEDLQERICLLQSDKENLMLQVSVLTEQVDAQADKIRELDSTLEDRKEQLDGTEEMLQQEMLARSSLENSKMDLVGQMSELRRKLTATEHERAELAEKYKKLEAELIICRGRIVERDAELATLKARLARNGTITPSPDNYQEVEKLKNALESLMISKDEKEKKIEELTLLVSRQKRVHDWIPTDRRASDPIPPESHHLELLYSPSGDSNKSESRLLEKPPPVPRSGPQLTSTPATSPGQWSDPRYSPCPSQASLKSIPKASSSENVTPTGTRTPPAKRHYSTIPRQHGVQVLQQIQQQLQQHHRVDSTLSSVSTASAVPVGSHKTSESLTPTSKSYHNLLNPNLDAFRSNGNGGSGGTNGGISNNRTNGKSAGVSFGKLFFRLRNGKRSCSAPELAPEPEIVPAPFENDQASLKLSTSTLPHDTSPLREKEKSKGLKRIFGKLKRSGSHTMDLKDGEFKRGGVRATAGPRLGWSNEPKLEKQDKPFKEWDTAAILEWLSNMGLGAYENECKRWVKNGEHLLKATPHDLEKEMGVKNVLHRKKLQLAIQAKGGIPLENNKKTKNDPNNKLASGDGKKEDPMMEKAIAKLDHHWVVRWLDDVGLPQYKDSFVDSRVDGRVLHYLTVDDLFTLKVSNSLHHVSIKRGIQVLREKNFDAYCLKRRSLPDENKDYTSNEVVLWTNHRVMEWLRTVDLSEYAPNLRGSGVHGALIVHEPKFNAELLAALLNIPPSKTLLRRHLTTQFKLLVGPTLMQVKRDCEIQQQEGNTTPLTPNTKVKAIHKGQFTLLRKKGKGDVAFEDLVCPLDSTLIKMNSSVEVAEPQTEKIEEKTAEEIEAVSKDISSLTNKLQDERLLATMETTNV